MLVGVKYLFLWVRFVLIEWVGHGEILTDHFLGPRLGFGWSLQYEIGEPLEGNNFLYFYIHFIF